MARAVWLIRMDQGGFVTHVIMSAIIVLPLILFPPSPIILNYPMIPTEVSDTLKPTEV